MELFCNGGMGGGDLEEEGNERMAFAIWCDVWTVVSYLSHPPDPIKTLIFFLNTQGAM